jgi:ribosomal protein L30/L7E
MKLKITQTKSTIASPEGSHRHHRVRWACTGIGQTVVKEDSPAIRG